MRENEISTEGKERRQRLAQSLENHVIWADQFMISIVKYFDEKRSEYRTPMPYDINSFVRLSRMSVQAAGMIRLLERPESRGSIPQEN